jgi:hypothetical protein
MPINPRQQKMVGKAPRFHWDAFSKEPSGVEFPLPVARGSLDVFYKEAQFFRLLSQSGQNLRHHESS